jgi:sterol desaturase/sphingolipid hydroxylase (fatty acid hydroxylase superfamily)
VTFGLVEVVLLIGAFVVTLAGAVPLSITLAALCGGVLHGWLAIRVHELCHAAEERVRTWPLARKPALLAIFHRLRDFHDAHHTSRGNYGLLIPPIDVVAGTQAGIAEDRDDLAARLFPGFAPERSSSCGESLL